MRQLELTERMMRLRGVPVLRGIAPAELAQVAASLRERTFHKGEVLLREDEPPRAFHLLTLGTVTMRRRGRSLGTVSAPGGVGFLSALARNAGATEAVAETYTEAYELGVDALDEVFEDHFSVLLGTFRWIAERLIAESRALPPRPYVPPETALDELVGERPLGIVERMFLLRRSRGFVGANLNSVARLARRMTELRLPAGATLWRPGDASDHTLFVAKGMLELRWGDGPSVQRVGPGYAVGGAEALCSLPRWNELVASEPVVALRGSREVLLDMFEDDREVAVKFMALLAGFLMSIWDKKAEAGIAAVGTLAPPGGAP